MKVEIFAKNIDLDNKLNKYIQKKVDSLDRILGKSKEERICDFRIKKDASAKNGEIYFAEATIKTPNKNYGAEASGESIFEAIDELKDEVAKKIRRNKDKKESLIKKGGRKIKELLKFGS